MTTTHDPGTAAHERRETELAHQLLLDVFDLPITFHRCLVSVCGSVTAALLLSHAITTTQEAQAGHFGDNARDVVDGWFTLSQDQWHRETGMTRWEQETARRLLRQAGFLIERREGMPARVWFKVDKAAVVRALRKQAASNVSRTRPPRPP
jgi:hypothetical protein